MDSNSGYGQPDSEVTTPVPLQNKTPRDDINVTLAEMLLVDELNEHRELNNLNSLTSDPRLATIARHHSYDMATRDYFSHTSPEGEDHVDRLDDASYECRPSSENLRLHGWQTGNTTTEETLASETILAFMESAPHNEAMLVPEYTTVGIGIYVTAEGGVYVTMLLCR